MRSCGRRERRDGGGRGGGKSGETSGEGPGEESGGRGREKKGKIEEEKFTWGGEVKSGGGFSVPAALRCAGRLRARGSPSPRGLFVLFWVFGFFLLPSFGRGCICCALCALLGFLFPFFFFPFLPSTPLFIYYIYFLARVRLFLFRIARVLTPHLRV